MPPAIADPMSIPARWTTNQVCLMAGISYRQLDYWARTDLIRPTHDTAGSGFKRHYTLDDVFELYLCKQLLLSGLNLPSVRAVFNTFRKMGHLPELYVVIDTRSSIVSLVTLESIPEAIRSVHGVGTVIAMSVILANFKAHICTVDVELPEDWEPR